jgi:glycosyltransferase involved in cell wall biosynthesis
VGDWLATRPVDLVHVHYSGAEDGTPAVEAALDAGIAVLTTDHACSDDVESLWPARRRAASRQAAVLADSHAIARRLEARLGVEVEVLHHGIDPTTFERLPERAVSRRALGIPPHVPVVGSIGALFSAKGMHRLVEAVAGLGDGGGGVQLLILGEGPERPRLTALARDTGIELQLPGFLADVRPGLAAFDLFVLASDSEGLPTAVLQAMSAGVPVVACDVGGVGEALGGLGALVPPGDDAALRDAIRRGLAGHLASFRAPARRRVRQCFDVRQLAARVADIHVRALGGSLNRRRSERPAPTADLGPS